MTARDSGLRRTLPRRLSQEKLKRRLEAAAGDPERVAELVHELALAVIREVREDAEGRPAEPGPPGDPSA